ncbi:Ty3/Gypsy family RNase HI domain-containing protein, partial [Salmonella enterica subsp. enterica serovar Anatum]|nr:Ty3/Gypsy family RNase HI domain-containing protein [Salmonella enterica subsp. enterica serovar Anatum]
IFVQANALSYGLRAALVQESEGAGRELVSYALRTMSACEKRYSQIEKEALSLAFACERFQEFISGIDVVLETDHKPPIQVLKSKPLDELTPRLQRICMRLMRYNFRVAYVPGKQLVLADSLSRNLLTHGEEGGDDDLPGEIEDHVRLLVGHLPATFNLFNRIRVEQKCNYVCSRLKEFCLFEWPVKSRLPNELSPFFQLKEDISYCDRYQAVRQRRAGK